MKQTHTNKLIHETSPYLLQHAHNPVNWRPWNDESLDLALDQNKLILISVGYSACHWCHVMEHESFEDEQVAEVMNSNYICIKVDREERPDIDQVYMNAVQVMTGMGGWPMNVVALPDGRPVWGGTSFKKEQWIDALGQISKLYDTQPEKLREYADKLEEGLQQIQIIETEDTDSNLHPDFFLPIIEKWKRSFDLQHGGYKRSPKFMMPNNYDFLIRYAHQNNDQDLLQHCIFTMNKISWGGVYDPIEGGFSRYSVDEKWHVPHFEKMLYDNAQLVETYANLYKITKSEWYKNVIDKTLRFIQSELTDASGAFYSALDADSKNSQGENEEGAYYVWTKEELQEILENDFELFSGFYNINSFGRWEKNHYVLIRNKSLQELSEEFDLTSEELNTRIELCNEKLLKQRIQRPKPGLDDKSLTSWNAMMISGYCKAYQALGTSEYLKIAQDSMHFILKNQMDENGRLWHSYKNGKSKINGYLEDYAFTIKALLDLYQSDFNESHLETAKILFDTVETNFLDKESGLFFFTSSEDRALITRNIDINDNVIPASNSVMAKNYYVMGQLAGNIKMIDKAEEMLKTISPKIQEYPQSYSNWLDLMLNFSHPFFEIAVAGENFQKKTKEFQRHYIPNTIIAATSEESNLPLLRNRLIKDKDLIYVCRKGACNLPVTSESEAIKEISQV